jgi:hypothetical protein
MPQVQLNRCAGLGWQLKGDRLLSMARLGLHGGKGVELKALPHS